MDSKLNGADGLQETLVMRTLSLCLISAAIFMPTMLGPATAGVSLAGCQALFDRAHGPGRLRVGQGQGGTLGAVLQECQSRYGAQLKDVRVQRAKRRGESVRVLSDALEGMAHSSSRKPHKRDKVKERADHSYAVGESFLRTMTGRSQRKDPWDYARGHGKGKKRH